MLGALLLVACQAPEGLPSVGPVALVRQPPEAGHGDRPDALHPAPPVTPGRIEEAFTGLLWEGALGWEPARVDGTTELGCTAASPLPLAYLGDVDFVRFDHGGGTLCVTLATPLSAVDPAQRDPRFGCLEGPPQWDTLVIPLDTEGQCAATPEIGPRFDATLGTVDGLLLPWLPAGAYALGIAPLCGEYAAPPACDPTTTSTAGASCVPYALTAAIVPGQAGCDALHDQLQGWLELQP